MRKRDIPLMMLAIVCFLAGAYVLMKPTVNQLQQKKEASVAVSEFFRDHPNATAKEEDRGTEPAKEPPEDLSEGPTEGPSELHTTETPYADLLEAMKAYNAEIFRNGQAGLADPWAYQAEVLRLSDYGLENETVGVLTIPKMDLQEPVYLGATKAHMDHGIAQLSISSMPIGGENTNCVLAGHRGWNGALFFRHIELLEIGDEVTLTNLWETMTYRVVEIKIIQPNQAEQILIQPGRDLLTLITCHPYGSGGRYRYVVYCARVSEKGGK